MAQSNGQPPPVSQTRPIQLYSLTQQIHSLSLQGIFQGLWTGVGSGTGGLVGERAEAPAAVGMERGVLSVLRPVLNWSHGPFAPCT